jgi:2,4-dienoyl-CoA reductase-like NADH-dependent reductase (Old Yellow Enzyme family)
MPKANSPTGFQPLKETALFSPFKLGPLHLEHRIVQAPLTRMRATKEEEGVFVPKELHVEYYSQRASKGGLQLTEATDIAKYVSHSQLVGANVLTCSRPADTQVYRACSLNLKSPVGRR